MHLQYNIKKLFCEMEERGLFKAMSIKPVI